jgi:hypothetical protein
MHDIYPRLGHVKPCVPRILACGCEDVGIRYRSIIPECEESEDSEIGTNKDDGTISRNVFVVYTVGANRRKEPPVQL